MIDKVKITAVQRISEMHFMGHVEVIDTEFGKRDFIVMYRDRDTLVEKTALCYMDWVGRGNYPEPPFPMIEVSEINDRIKTILAEIEAMKHEEKNENPKAPEEGEENERPVNL